MKTKHDSLQAYHEAEKARAENEKHARETAVGLLGVVGAVVGLIGFLVLSNLDD